MNPRPSIPPLDPAAAARLRVESLWLTRAWIVSLVVLFGGAIAWIFATRPENASWIWWQMFFSATTGKYVIFSGLAASSPLSVPELSLLSFFVDLTIGLTLAVFLPLFARVRGLGPWLWNLHHRAELAIKEYPRLRRMAFWGVVLFIYLPLPASGAIGGTFLAQIMGLSRTVGLIAIMTSSIFVCATFAGLALVLGAQAHTLLENPWVSVSGGVLGLCVIWLGWKRAKAMLQQR